ncbi:beta-lactamase [Aurantiacibacter gangjinensis]|uniref:Beta-lactamase n=1 Tax=Aurantiacibacter gangjinensis TaxID=502682 RepID=A0A0G9MS60_9SPHN|nr:beta-lactamase [Aurantiacibacter gangjinensis]
MEDVAVSEPAAQVVAEPAPQRSGEIAMPTDRNVLFWPQEVRAMVFRGMDRMPDLAASRVIEAGDTVRPLPAGELLDLGDYDLDGFMQAQSSAAIVIVHDGEVVLERYGLGFGPEQRWTSFSVAKSLVSTLVGAALEDGSIESLDDPVTRYIADLQGSAYDDVTVRQLLTMSSGVRWSENYSDPNSDVARFNNHQPTDGLDATVSYMRALPRANPAGENWRYSTGETNLVGVLVSEATGRPLADYLSEKIWTPFGMQQDATWLLSATGSEIGGCCIQASTRDMARFGLFTLTGGVIDGERVVPEGWFNEATDAAFQLDGDRAGYGYQWWTYGEDSYAADGIFGQGIFIDPARNLVIASNSNWASAGGNDGERRARFGFYRAVQAAVDARSGD